MLLVAGKSSPERGPTFYCCREKGLITSGSTSTMLLMLCFTMPSMLQVVSSIMLRILCVTMTLILQAVGALSSYLTKISYGAKNRVNGSKQQTKPKQKSVKASVVPSRIKKCVRFDLERTSIRIIPSRSDYSFIDLFQLHYNQKDYDRFELLYAG